MQIMRGVLNIPPRFLHGVATIGNFDGVHLGHAELLNELSRYATKNHLPSVVILFEPQPLEYFTQDKITTPRLTRLREKIHALQKYSPDGILILRFDHHLAKLSAKEFVEKILSQHLNISHLIIGDDFRFGRGREGNKDYLVKMGEQLNFDVTEIPAVTMDQERVSSTRIRQCLLNADLSLAEKLLGRPYIMEGRVVHGDKQGRIMGFPTANIFLHRKVTPLAGIYVVRMQLGARKLLGVANVGTRPTVGGTRTLLEVYLFNFNEEIYGQQVSVEFCKKLRPEEYYPNIDLLIAQMWQDAADAKEYFMQTGELS